MKKNNDSKNETQFKQKLSSAFQKTPPPAAGEFQKIINAYRALEVEPFWFRVVGTPLSTVTAAAMLVFAISLTQFVGSDVDVDALSGEDSLSWVSENKEAAPLLEAFNLQDEE